MSIKSSTNFLKINLSNAGSIVIALVALFANTGSAKGQQDGAILLDDITVVGTRTETSVQENPRSVSVVGQEQLKRQAPLSISEALRDVPGIELVDAGVPGMKRLQIRGESSRRVTILIDGQEITDHSTYGTPILINPAAVERIDVVRGPTSVLWGAKAIGGVINVITKKGAPDKAAELELGGTYYSGTEGRQGWASLGGTLGSLDYRVTGGIADHEDQKVPGDQFTSTGRLENTEYDFDDISAHIGLTLGANKNHYIAVKAEQYRLDTESWSEDPFALRFNVTKFNIDLPQRDRKKIGIHYDGKDLSGPVTKVHFDAYYQTIDRQFENNVDVFSPGFVIPPRPMGPPFPIIFPDSTISVRSTSDDRLVNYGGTGQIDLELIPRHYTIFGVEYLADALETTKTSFTEQNPPIFIRRPISNNSFAEARIDTFSVFAQDTWEIVDDLKLIGGVRYNRIKNELEKNESTRRADAPGSSTDHEVSTSVALTYSGIENTTLRALYSSGYISPTLLQLYSRNSAGGVTVLNNPNLEIETADNYEIGFRYEGDGLVIDATGYYTESEDYINFIACTAPGAPECNDSGTRTPNSIFANLDSAQTYGVELLLQYTLPGTNLTPYATGAYTRRKLEYEGFSTYDTNVPRVSGRFGLRYEMNVAGVTAWADLFMRAASETKNTEFDATAAAAGANPIVTDKVDSWKTLNFAFGGTYGPDDMYRLAVQFNNITDEEYRPLTDALPGVGRSVEVTAAVKF